MSDGNLRFSIVDRYRSIVCACKGIATMLRYEHNAWVHTLATFVVCGFGFFVGLTKYEWCVLVLAIMSVWTAEALNTAFEFLCDVASPSFHPLVEKAKDVAAGAVFVSSIGSVIVGMLLFGPRIMEFFRG